MDKPRKRVTLKDLDEGWVIPAVSMVDEPSVPKALFFAFKRNGEDVDVKSAMKASGVSAADLEDATGIAREHIYSYGTGGRSMGRAAAKKIGEALAEDPNEVLLWNQLSVAAKAKSEGDADKLLGAIQQILRATDKLELSDTAREELEEAVRSHLGAPDAPEEEPEEEDEEPKPKKPGKKPSKKSRGDVLDSLLLPGTEVTAGARKSVDSDDFGGRDALGRKLRTSDKDDIERDGNGCRIRNDFGDFDGDDMEDDFGGRDAQGRRIR